MAIYSAVPPPPQFGGATATASHHDNENAYQHVPAPNQSSTPIDIESWTVSALQSLSISPIARGTGTPLSIPLDENEGTAPTLRIKDARPDIETRIAPPRRPPSRRDSQRRREALLKGKEGSRQRRRWENARLVGVPNVQPPQPYDWEPRPTHPVHNVPYQVAAVWDLRLRADIEAKRTIAVARKQRQTQTLGDEHVAGRVPRELFLRAKKTPVVKIWVRSLEEPVRKFLVEREMARESEIESEDSEDDEIVFMGRHDALRDGWKRARRERGQQETEGMVFDALEEDESSAFKRWLTHSISDYYGLESQSVLVGNPTRKVVFVGIKQMKAGHAPSPSVISELPRPLWELC